MQTPFHICAILYLALASSVAADAAFALSPGFREIRMLSGNPPTGAVLHNEFSLKRGYDPDAPLRVNISNDYAMGTEDDAVGSVWMAATVASMLAGKPLNGYDLTIRFTGRGTGPSAGGVLCLNFLSALMRQEFPEDVVMTGTITPDGGIGPVGGVPYKLLAAKRNGFKRAIIPLFSSAEEFIDPDTGQTSLVDPIEFGRSLGLDVKPVETIAEAYEWLYEVPIRKVPKSLPPVRYSPQMEAALRKDCETLSKTLQSVLSSEHHQERIASAKTANDEFSKSYQGVFSDAQKTLQEPAALLSRRHQTLSESVPKALAAEKLLDAWEQLGDTALSRDFYLAKVSELLSAANAAASRQISVPDTLSWQRVQISPEIYELFNTSQFREVSDATDLSTLSDEDLASLLSNLLGFVARQDQARELDSLANVSSELQSTSSGGNAFDESSLRSLLQMLLTTAQASAKTAQTTGLQRKADYEADIEKVEDGEVKRKLRGRAEAYNQWVQSGAAVEGVVNFVNGLASEGKSRASLVRGCYKVMDALAWSSASYVVFESIGANAEMAENGKPSVDSDNNVLLNIDNPGHAARMVSVAKRNAELEVGKLLSRSDEVVMPVYFYELGEHYGQSGAFHGLSLLNTLTYYYRAYLYAWLMNTFLDMEEGKFI